jgi:hypothetical protein
MTTAQITCLACGHADAVQNESGLEAPAFFETNVFKCSECGARMAYGKLAPRVVVEPFTDERGCHYIRHRFQDPITKADLFVADLDPQYAAMVAKAGISLVIP